MRAEPKFCPQTVEKGRLTSMAPSEEGAVSEADWGRENLKYYEFYVNTDKTVTFSLPQSPLATAPSSEGALGAPAPEGLSTRWRQNRSSAL